MYRFPGGLYTDVRIEHCSETTIKYILQEIEDCRERSFSAAFVRVHDGHHWYYSSTTETEAVQSEIDSLASMANPRDDIDECPVVQRMEHNRGSFLKFVNDTLSAIDLKRKMDFLTSFFPVVCTNSYVTSWDARYVDRSVTKEFFSSRGANLTFDTQHCGILIDFNMASGKRTFSSKYDRAANIFDDLPSDTVLLKRYLERCQDFMLSSKPVEPGIFTIILSPEAAGIFAHESFGHKSEADLMLGDEAMKREWTIGKRVGSPLLTIVDDGDQAGSGYCPFDDEGTRSRKTKLIENGILAGRLHSSQTAAELSEELTGNARAVNHEFQPIVRQTTTYIEPGSMTREQLFSGVKDGYFIDTVNYGFGMSTFTLAPERAYRIRDGAIAEPVRISVITGSVFETLNEIDGVSDELEIISDAGGGCGKMEQYPLPVGLGGPYVRVRKMNVL